MDILPKILSHKRTKNASLSVLAGFSHPDCSHVVLCHVRSSHRLSEKGRFACYHGHFPCGLVRRGRDVILANSTHLPRGNHVPELLVSLPETGQSKSTTVDYLEVVIFSSCFGQAKSEMEDPPKMEGSRPGTHREQSESQSTRF